MLFWLLMKLGTQSWLLTSLGLLMDEDGQAVLAVDIPGIDGDEDGHVGNPFQTLCASIDILTQLSKLNLHHIL